MIKIGLAIATYNEAGNIEPILEAVAEETAKILDASFEVLVIDDSSPDGTADKACKTAAKLNRNNLHISVLVRSVKDGLGRAYVAGFTNLIAKGVDYIISMDADFSHNPVYLATFVQAVQAGNDLVVASRYIPGGQTPDWPWHRRMMSQYGNYYARFFLGKSISDYTGGFNLYSVDILKKVNLEKLQASGYGFQTELKFRSLKYAKSLHEIPIIFKDRQHGYSKIPKSTLVDSLVMIPRLRFGKK